MQSICELVQCPCFNNPGCNYYPSPEVCHLTEHFRLRGNQYAVFNYYYPPDKLPLADMTEFNNLYLAKKGVICSE